MEVQPFSIGEAFKEGWKLTKENLGFLIGYQIILYALTLLFSGTHSNFRLALWHILGWTIIVLVKMGLYNSALLIAAGVKPSFEQLYQNWRMFISWVIASILFGIMFTIGLILLVVPGFYILARYGLFPFFILDRKMGPIDALKAAAEATEGIRWQIFLLFLACLGLNLLGLLLLGIGLLFSVPVTLLALALVYQKITHKELNVVESNL